MGWIQQKLIGVYLGVKCDGVASQRKQLDRDNPPFLERNLAQLKSVVVSAFELKLNESWPKDVGEMMDKIGDDLRSAGADPDEQRRLKLQPRLASLLTVLADEGLLGNLQRRVYTTAELTALSSSIQGVLSRSQPLVDELVTKLGANQRLLPGNVDELSGHCASMIVRVHDKYASVPMQVLKTRVAQAVCYRDAMKHNCDPATITEPDANRVITKTRAKAIDNYDKLVDFAAILPAQRARLAGVAIDVIRIKQIDPATVLKAINTLNQLLDRAGVLNMAGRDVSAKLMAIEPVRVFLTIVLDGVLQANGDLVENLATAFNDRGKQLALQKAMETEGFPSDGGAALTSVTNRLTATLRDHGLPVGK